MSHHPRHMTFQGAAQNLLEADIYGHGSKTALLLHGGGQTRHAWRKTARQLADHDYTAIAVDQRGHGASAWVDNGDYAFSDYGADARIVAEEIASRFGAKPIAIGASLGGIASLYAEGLAPVLSALVLVDITPRMDPKGVAHIQGFMRQNAETGFASVEECAEAVARYLVTRPRPPSVEGLRKNLRLREDGRYVWHWDPRFLDGPRTVGHDREGVIAFTEAAARRLTIPTMLVRGGSSELIDENHVALFRELVPHAQFADVSGAGHMVAGDKNDVFASAILKFMNSI